MQIITPDYILTPDKLLKNQSVAFNKTIKKIASLEELVEEFPNATITKLQKNSLLVPGFINAHVHLEFSANKTQLVYGNFMDWLHSVIEKRDSLINGCENNCMKRAVDSMLCSGITTFGAISSHGMDLEVCTDAPQNIIFFNELIGSNASMADALFGDFLARVDASKSIKRDGFYPAIALHSPYSVHPVLVKKALKKAKDENLKVSAHFMESSAERVWLDESDGDFKVFFEKFLKQSAPISSADEFLQSFNNKKTVFAHAIKANDDELDIISKNGHVIIHCPISNRLLGNGVLDLKKLDEKKIDWICATDGLSSNYKLDLLEELKCALFMHPNMPLIEFANRLLRSITIDAAKALDINSGEIAEGKNADMLVFDLEEEPDDKLAIHLILQRYNISKIYINSKLVKGDTCSL